MAPAKFEWDRTGTLPSVLPHTMTKQELVGQYVRKYIEITAGAAAAMAAEVFKCTIVDAFAGGGLFRNETTDENVVGTPLRILHAIEGAKETVSQVRRRTPLRLDIATHFNDLKPEVAAYLKEVLKDQGHEIDGQNIRITDGTFEAKLDEMIGAIKEQQPRAGKCIFILDQTGYSQVRPEHIQLIFNELRGAEVILTMAASRMVSPFFGLSKRHALDQKIGGWLLREDVIEMFRRGENNDETKAVKLRALMEELVRKTGATGYSCFTLRPKQGNYMWIMHLVRNNRAAFARDTMLDVQWRMERASLHIGGTPADYLGFQGLRQGDPEAGELFQFELADAERTHLRNDYGTSVLKQWLTRANLSRVGGVSVNDILRETENRTALTQRDRVLSLTELRERLETKGFEWRDAKGKQIGQGSNRVLKPDDRIHLGRQGSLFGP